MAGRNKGLHCVTWILMMIGGLNWLLYAFGWDIGSWFGDSADGVMMVVYILIGLSALYELFTHKGLCKACETGNAPVA
ncbi:MAG: DUF378 domain-containing protein [Patescibacteria group bacterium]